MAIRIDGQAGAGDGDAEPGHRACECRRAEVALGRQPAFVVTAAETECELLRAAAAPSRIMPPRPRCVACVGFCDG
jgi:hypothetical protein